MKNKETWRVILQIIASIVSAALTALGTTSCMGYGPVVLSPHYCHHLPRGSQFPSCPLFTVILR